jgi:hypothetical protein
MEISPQSIVVIILALAIIFTLVVVLIQQQRKIKELSTPKYGFLGKPLNLVLTLFIFGGTLALFNILNQPQPEVEISNANFVIELNIIATKVADLKYKLNVLPVVDGVVWGIDNYPFDVYWTIEGATTQKLFENGISRKNTGGVMVDLSPGTNKITATIYIDLRKFEKSIEVDV